MIFSAKLSLYRLPIILSGLIVLSLVSIFLFFACPESNDKVSLPKISTIDGAMIPSTAAMILLNEEGMVVEEVGEIPRTLPSLVWGGLLVVLTLLLLMNWFFPGVNRLSTSPFTWHFEAVLALSFLLLWGYWDEARVAWWFPWSVFQMAGLTLALFLSLYREERA